jgi:hypothetical protein
MQYFKTACAYVAVGVGIVLSAVQLLFVMIGIGLLIITCSVMLVSCVAYLFR